MDFIGQNIRIIKKTLGLSLLKLANQLNEIAAPNSFSKDTVYNYETGKTPPTEPFKRALAKLAGVTVADLETKKLKASDIKEIEDTKEVQDAGSLMLHNQVEGVALLRVILSILAEIQSPLSKEKMLPTQLLSIYRKMVRDEAEQVRKELKL